MNRLAAIARRAAKAVMGPAEPPLISRLIQRDQRSQTFFQAIEYINFEQVPGDIVECGVFGGLSLAILAKGASFDPAGARRRIVGIDSFDGLPPSAETHVQWRAGDCAHVHAWHPLSDIGARVTPETTRALFARCGLPPPVLHEGLFSDVCRRIVPADLEAVALLHVDCDLYESTRDALEGLAPALQDGSMVLFDDWFHYKGHPGRGESRAFTEFLAAHPEWTAVPWRSYATFCQGFILSRR